MAVEAITKTSDGYALTGFTNVGRPVTITIQLGVSRKVDVSVEPAPGSPTEEPLVERELNHIMAEYSHINSRINTIFEMTPASVSDEKLLAAVANVISRDKISAEAIEQLIFENQPRMGM